MSRWFPSLRSGLCRGPGGQPAIHSSIPDMMGFGHVPTGSIRNDGHARAGGPRRSSSARRSVTETQAAAGVSRHLTSPSRIA